MLHSSRSGNRSLFAAVVAVLALFLSLLTVAPAQALSDTGTGGVFVPASGRVLDTKYNTGGYNTPMSGGAWRTVKIAGNAGIPDDGSVGAVAVTAVILDTTYGQLRGRPNADTATTLMSIYAGGGATSTSNSSIVALNDDGTLQVMTSTDARLVLDVQGYYTSNNDGTAAGGFVPVAGTRIVDTRSGTGLPKAVVASGDTKTIQVTGNAGVPAGASGVVVTMIAVNKEAKIGTLTPFAYGAPQPKNSFQYQESQDTAMSAQVALSSNGKLSINNSGSSTDLVVDVQGYFTAAGKGGAMFTPAAGRAYDTRAGSNTALGTNETRSIQLANVAGIPAMGSGVTAVVITLTAVHSDDSEGRAIVWADGTSRPSITSMDYVAGSTRSNMVTVPLGANGKIDLYNNGTATEYVIDIQGWYATSKAPAVGSQFVSASGKIVDTRSGQGTTTLAANTWSTVQISGVAGIPTTGVTAVSVMAVVAESSGSGTLTVRPSGTISELPVMLYADKSAANTSNSAIMTLGTGGKIDVKATTKADVILSLEGYYTATSGSTTGGFVPTTPAVVAQSQAGAPLQPGTTTHFQITGDIVPSTAKAVFLNISTTHQNSSAGDWSIYPSDGPSNSTSFNIPVAAGVTTSNGAAVALGASGAVDLKLRGAAADVSIRVEGYFLSGSSGGMFTPATGNLLTQKTPVNGALTLPVSGKLGIPKVTDGLTSVVLHIDSFPGANDPTISSSVGKVSTVNVKADGTDTWDRALDTVIGTARSNTVTVAVGFDGAIAIQNSNYGHALLGVSIEGWYVGPSTTLCKHDDVTISNLATTGASDGAPTLSAAVTNGLGQTISTSIYVQDPSGNAVGGTPSATADLDSGTSAVFHPTGLSAGTTYTWWIYGNVDDSCAAQATSAKQTFTMGKESTLTLATSSVSLVGTDLGVRTGQNGGSFTPGTLTAGSDGATSWISTLKLNFQKIPAGARIVKAILHAGTPTCLASAPCSSQTMTITPLNSDVNALPNPDEAAAIPVTSDATNVTATGGDIDLTGLVQSWYSAGDTSNNGAVVAAPAGTSNGLRLNSFSIEVVYAAPTVPSAPILLRTTAGDGGVLASWVSPLDSGYLDQTGSGDGVSSYDVVVTSSSGSTILTKSVQGLSAVVTGLVNGASYKIQVSARNSIGSGSATSVSTTPVAVPNGPSIYIDAVRQMTTAQTQLEAGESASTDDVAGNNLAVRDGLGVTAGRLIQDSEAAVNSGMQVTENPTKLADVLASYDVASKTVTVFATVINTGNTIDTSDPNDAVSVDTKSSEKLGFTLTTANVPMFVGTADTQALASPVSPRSGDTLVAAGTDSSEIDQSIPYLSLDAQTGDISDGTSSSSPAVVSRAASKYVSVNYTKLAKWANDNAAVDFDDGYDQDCTDFVSRAMIYGGGMHMIFPPGSGALPHSDSNVKHWYHGGNAAVPRYSTSWGLARDNLQFLKSQGAAFSESKSGLGVGDIIYPNWKGSSDKNHIDHAGVIVKITKKNVYIAQHDPDRVDSLEKEKGQHSWRAYGAHLHFYVARPVEAK